MIPAQPTYNLFSRLRDRAPLWDRTVRNLSNAGAALDVTSPVGIPDRFTLVLPGDGRHMPCHVVWRKQRRLGVVFD
jgi:hypothetical protein